MPSRDTEPPAAFENAAVGIGVVDVRKGRRLVQASRRLAAIFDLDPQEIVGQDLCTRCSVMGSAEAGAQAPPRPFPNPEKCGSFTHELQFLRKDGTQIAGRCGLARINRAGKAAEFIWVVEETTQRVKIGETVRESAGALQSLVDNVPAMILYVDRDLRCGFANRRYADFFGMRAGSVIGKHMRDVIGTATFQEHEQHFDNVLRGNPVSYQMPVQPGESGEPRHVDVRLVPLADAQDEIQGFYALVIDITEQKRTEQALLDSAERLRVFADNVPAMSIAYDDQLRCVFANKHFAEFFDLTTTSIVGKRLWEIIGQEAYEEIKSHFDRVLKGHRTVYERIRRLPNGESAHLEVKLIPRFAQDGRVTGLFAVTTDITEHKRAEQRIRHIAQHDSLTGLPNRLLFVDRLAQAVRVAKRNSRKLALLYLDLDSFKPVNDTLGHDAGDEILKGVARRVRELIRDSDTLARLGGDEFTVLLPDINSRENAEKVAHKIIAAITAPFYLGTDRARAEIGTSIGIAFYPSDATDPDALLKAADTAMYEAKSFKNCFRFYSDLK